MCIDLLYGSRAPQCCETKVCPCAAWPACRRMPSRSFRRRQNTRLDDHLGDALAAEGLGADEVLALEAGEGVADGGQGQEDGGGDQGAAAAEDAEVLDDGHDGVGSGAHVVGGDAADEGVELLGGRADAEEEGDLNEEDDQGGGTVAVEGDCQRCSRGGPRQRR